MPFRFCAYPRATQALYIESKLHSCHWSVLVREVFSFLHQDENDFIFNDENSKVAAMDRATEFLNSGVIEIFWGNGVEDGIAKLARNFPGREVIEDLLRRLIFTCAKVQESDYPTRATFKHQQGLLGATSSFCQGSSRFFTRDGIADSTVPCPRCSNQQLLTRCRMIEAVMRNPYPSGGPVIVGASSSGGGGLSAPTGTKRVRLYEAATTGGVCSTGGGAAGAAISRSESGGGGESQLENIEDYINEGSVEEAITEEEVVVVV